jgi:hypothetical protein
MTSRRSEKINSERDNPFPHASAAFKIPIICSSEKRARFILPPVAFLEG